MAYNNKQYNTRYSGRYNTPGNFLTSGEPFGKSPCKQQQQQQNLQTVKVHLKDEDAKIETDTSSKGSRDDGSGSVPVRPHWMKSKLPGGKNASDIYDANEELTSKMKKVSNKERRRRQNENLRRLLTPKNALMVLNEMMPNQQVANQFKVEPSNPAQFKTTNTLHNFCADLTIHGSNYKGYGDNKLMARNAAAEQAIRDLIIKKMSQACNSDSTPSLEISDSGSQIDGAGEEALPMIQLASYALHKLFSEWEYSGHKVPQLRPTTLSTSEIPVEPASKKNKELPANATSLHPCMLLTYMRPHLEYRELSIEGDRPQNIMFTMGIDVDGFTYIGKAPNKKEARKAAAKAACEAMYNIKFELLPPAQ